MSAKYAKTTLHLGQIYLKSRKWEAMQDASNKKKAKYFSAGS